MQKVIDILKKNWIIALVAVAAVGFFLVKGKKGLNP